MHFGKVIEIVGTEFYNGIFLYYIKLSELEVTPIYSNVSLLIIQIAKRVDKPVWEIAISVYYSYRMLIRLIISIHLNLFIPSNVSSSAPNFSYLIAKCCYFFFAHYLFIILMYVTEEILKVFCIFIVHSFINLYVWNYKCNNNEITFSLLSIRIM